MSESLVKLTIMVFILYFIRILPQKGFQNYWKRSNFNQNAWNFVCSRGSVQTPLRGLISLPRPLRYQGTEGKGRGARSRFEASGPRGTMIRPYGSTQRCNTCIARWLDARFIASVNILSSVHVWQLQIASTMFRVCDVAILIFCINNRCFDFISLLCSR